jgi:hypothetical protein
MGSGRGVVFAMATTVRRRLILGAVLLVLSSAAGAFELRYGQPSPFAALSTSFTLASPSANWPAERVVTASPTGDDKAVEDDEEEDSDDLKRLLGSRDSSPYQAPACSPCQIPCRQRYADSADGRLFLILGRFLC